MAAETCKEFLRGLFRRVDAKTVLDVSPEHVRYSREEKLDQAALDELLVEDLLQLRVGELMRRYGRCFLASAPTLPASEKEESSCAGKRDHDKANNQSEGKGPRWKTDGTPDGVERQLFLILLEKGGDFDRDGLRRDLVIESRSLAGAFLGRSKPLGLLSEPDRHGLDRVFARQEGLQGVRLSRQELIFGSQFRRIFPVVLDSEFAELLTKARKLGLEALLNLDLQAQDKALRNAQGVLVRLEPHAKRTLADLLSNRARFGARRSGFEPPVFLAGRQRDGSEQRHQDGESEPLDQAHFRFSRFRKNVIMSRR